MKVIKNFAARDDNVDKLSDIFDELVMKTTILHNLDTIEFHVRDKNVAKLHDMNAIISVDYDDHFLRENDEKGMRSLILHSLYHIIIRKRYDVNIPHFIEDILINRQMIADGYSDYVFYPAYIFLLKKKEADFHDFLAINIPWLSFSGTDNHNTEFLKEMIKKIKYDKMYEKRVTRLFESLKKDITDEANLAHSINLYEVMLCR
jgi:hypothetical protein